MALVENYHVAAQSLTPTQALGASTFFCRNIRSCKRCGKAQVGPSRMVFRGAYKLAEMSISGQGKRGEDALNFIPFPRLTLESVQQLLRSDQLGFGRVSGCAEAALDDGFQSRSC
jgi:hypothetical protein